MPINSKRKGSVGERELANKLKEYGYDTRRSVQYNGKDGQADVLGLPHIHIEAKRVERLNLYDAMDQAKRDAKNGDKPAVFHRKKAVFPAVLLRCGSLKVFQNTVQHIHGCKAFHLR